MNAGGKNRAERRLAAILAADVAGYSRLIGEDEDGTLDRLRSIRAEVIDPKVATHRGRLVKTTGDGLLVEFASVVDALRCATEWQQAMEGRNAGIADAERIEFRVGINVGDVVVEDGDIFGDGVNVAARLEALADPGGICVSARVREDAAGRLDLAFDDLGEQELKNIARSVRVYSIRRRTSNPQSPRPSPPPHAEEGVMHAGAPNHPPPQSPGQARGGEGRVGASAPPALALPDKPSIAVLPFQNISGDPEQEYFADGMVEEIITALSRIRWLFVIARNSTFTYKGQAVDVKEVGRELGVRYVLEGSVRKGGNRVRITGQLIDAETGTHLWADRFDGLIEDVFELQDKIALSVAGVIEPALQAAEMRRSAARPTTDLTAYDLYLRALATIWPITKERMFEALGLFEQAITIDRHYGPALSWAAMCHVHLIINGWTEAPETNVRKAGDFARQAVQATQNDPAVLANAAVVLAQLGEDIGAMMALVDRALVLNPSFARGWMLSGLIRIFAGQHDLAIEHIETALRLSPRERMGQPLSAIGTAYFFKHRFDEAAAKLLLAIQDHPGFPLSYRTLAACYAHMGRLDEARATVAKLLTITLVVPSEIPFRNPEDRELYLSGLRLATGETS
jgi:TolB-like protein/class 3 adenylate cyclase/Flp pilus assembly protein TadD